MNRIKQLDAQLDRWAETRWPGITNKLQNLVSVLVGAALGAAVIYLALRLWLNVKGYV